MTDYLITGASARWQVLWLVRKGGKTRVVEQDFEQDLMGAIALFTKAKAAGKPFATLRCANVGFPPPEKYQPYIERKKVKENGKTKIKEFTVTPMVILNRRGIMWCPYCMQMRKPVYQSGFRVDGIRVPEEGIHCPLCGTSHRDGHMRRYNPALVVPTKRTRRVAPKSVRRTRKR